ncbi:small membrane protein [Klebsiella pneumoniae]|nr:small membrane protein [Klebsiella pneumoniae]
MSGLILFIVAVALLGVAIYSPGVSYLKERRASQLPVHKKKK